MSRKRYPVPRCKPGELKVAWGKSRYEGPDIFYAHGGGGANRADGHLLHCMFSGYGWEKGKYGAEHSGFLEELEARGYDLTTLKFYIRQKEKPTE